MSRIIGLFRADRAASYALLALLGVDIALIGMRVVRGALIRIFDYDGLIADRGFKLVLEQSQADAFAHVQIGLCLVCMLYVWLRLRRAVYLAWAAVFAFALFDALAAVHERLGRKLVRQFDVPPVLGLSAQDGGELVAWAVVGLPLLAFLAWSIRRCGPEHRRICGDVAALFCVFLLFAVVVDAFHAAVRHRFGGMAGSVLEVLEDGGQMVAISLICAFTLLLARWSPDEPIGGPATVGRAAECSRPRHRAGEAGVGALNR